MKTLVQRILCTVILAATPYAADAVQGTITVNNVVVSQTDDVGPCLVLPGETQCTATAEFPPAETGEVIILPGALVEATAVASNTDGGPGVINSVKLTGLALLYLGDPGGNVQISYSNRFPLPDDVWTTAGFGGFRCDSNTLSSSETGNTICRNYGFTASGTFCRLDENGDCQTAADDVISMVQSVSLESANGATTKTEDIGDGIRYEVGPGGVQNNEFFPLAKVAVPAENVSCETLLKKPCAAAETLNATLVFNLNPSDAIFLSASPTGIGGTNPGTVNNRLKFTEIDMQPIYDPENNDLNLSQSGTRSVAVISKKDSDPTKTFKPESIVAGTVLLSIGPGAGVPPVGKPTLRDLNRDGIKDAIFTFNVPDLLKAGGKCSGLEQGSGVGIAVLTATAPFTTTYTTVVGKGQGKKEQTVTVTENVEFSGSQSFTCAPSAGQ